MNQEQFLEFIKKSNKEGFKLIEMKNSDYAGKKDPFKNFKLFETLMQGVDLNKCDLTEIALMVRLSDKIQRMANLLDKPPAVETESFDDTCLDNANYSHILRAYRKNKLDQNKMYASKETTARDIDN